MSTVISKTESDMIYVQKSVVLNSTGGRKCSFFKRKLVVNSEYMLQEESPRVLQYITGLVRLTQSYCSKYTMFDSSPSAVNFNVCETKIMK